MPYFQRANTFQSVAGCALSYYVPHRCGDLVLNDFHEVQNLDTVAVQEKLAEGVRLLLLKADGEQKAATIAKSFEKPRMDNRKVLIAADKSLRHGCNITLAMFIPRRIPRPLTVGQRRVLVDWVHPVSGAKLKRSVILSDDGSRWFEMGRTYEDDKRVSPTLHKSSDFGAIGVYAWHFYFFKLGARGTWIWDRWHVYGAEMDAGIQTAGLTLPRAQVGVELNMLKEPFAKDINFSKLKACGVEFFKLSPTNALFDLNADDIAAAIDFRPRDLSGDGWLFEVHALAKNKWNSLTAGTRAKSGRWWSVEERGQAYWPFRPIIRTVIIYYGFRKRWWTSIDTCPIMHHWSFRDDDDIDPAISDSEVAVGAEDPADGDAVPDHDADPTELKLTKSKAREMLKQQRDKSTGTLKFVAKTTSVPINARLFPLLVFFPDPVRKHFDKEMELYRTGPKGVRELNVGLAHGSMLPMLQGMIDHTFSVDFAAKCAFSTSTKSATVANEDRIIAVATWRWFLTSAGCFARLHLLHMHLPPYCLVGLLERDHELVASKLALLKRIWELQRVLEDKAREDKRAQEALRAMIFPYSTFCNEVMVQLFETGFAHVDDELLDELQNYAEGFWGTLVDELTGNLWRDCARHDKAGKLGPSAAWHRTVAKSPLLDVGFPMVLTTAHASNLAVKGLLPDAMFHGAEKECSLSAEQLGQIHETAASWPSPNPGNYKESVMHTWGPNLDQSLSPTYRSIRNAF